jgi:predicted acyltransferase
MKLIKQQNSPDRILSIDIFRGFTMFLLIGEFTHLYSHLGHGALEGTIIGAISTQFHHHPWNGLRFWDLIQPYFMFIVGLSLPFAVKSRIKKGDTSRQILKHVIKRSVILFLMGWGLYCIGPGKITFQFQNVLAQIGVTYLIAYLIMNRSFRFQVVFSLCLLVLTEGVYRLFPVEGFNHAFVNGENFGNWVDSLLGVKSSWASINAIPTAAHTIWGVLAGKLLMSDQSTVTKFKKLLITGAVLVVVGYLMDPLTPIIKRISTSSFVIVSGGWSLVTLALFFWIADIKKWTKGWPLFFGVVSMNSLFIYLFSHVGGADLVETILHPFTYALFDWGSELTAQILTSLLVWMALWGLCYWMYKKRIFIKI